jgi:hypothetical protein
MAAIPQKRVVRNMKSMSFMGGLLFFSLYPLRNKFNPDASLKWKIKKEVAPLNHLLHCPAGLSPHGP